MKQRQKMENLVLETGIEKFLYRLVVGRFKWDGLPYGLTSEQFERFISIDGLAVGFRHPSSMLLLPANWAGELNIFYMPTRYFAVGQGETFDLPATDCVPFYNSSSRASVRDSFEDAVKSLKNIMQAAHSNVRHQKNPWVFAGNQDEVNSLKAAYQNAEDNYILTFVTGRTMKEIETAKRFYPFNNPFIASDLMCHYREILNNFLTILGYDNVQIEKKERLISDEAHGNDSLVKFNRMDGLRMRQDAAREYNNRFGQNIAVKWVGCDDCEGGADNELRTTPLYVP